MNVLWKSDEKSSIDIAEEIDGLKKINEALWEIEDDIRDKERAKEFDEKFIELARAFYVTNDQRANIKRVINVKLGSDLVEEKSYVKVSIFICGELNYLPHIFSLTP